MLRSPRLSWFALLLAALGPPTRRPRCAALDSPLMVGQPVTADLPHQGPHRQDTVIYHAQGEIRDSANGGGPTTVRIYRNGRQDLTRRSTTRPASRM